MTKLTAAETEHLREVMEEAFNCLRNEQLYLARSEDKDEETEIAIEEMQLACDALDSGIAILELRTTEIMMN